MRCKTLAFVMGGLLAAAPFAMAQTESQTGAGQYGQTQPQGEQTSQPSQTQQSRQYGQTQQEEESQYPPRVQQSRAAASMLHHTDMARQAIRERNQQKAKTHIDQALEAAGKIQTTAETIPIYTEFEQVSVIEPLQAARTEREGESTASREAPQTQTQTQSAERQQQPSTQQPSGAVVEDVEGGFTSVAVDMSQARTHLDAAKTALRNNDMMGADRALQAVQTSVSMTTAQADMPLVKARQNLALALTQVRENQASAAQAPLKEAIDALESYRQMPSAKHSTEAAQLSRDIQNYVGTMQQKSQSATAEQIQQWWNMVANWTGTEQSGQPQA